MTSPKTASAGDYMNRSHVLAPLPQDREPASPLPDDGLPPCAGANAYARSLLAGRLSTGEAPKGESWALGELP